MNTKETNKMATIGLSRSGLKANLKPLVYGSLIAMGLWQGGAFAQSGDSEEVTLEEITVTGSRIRTRTGMETPNPVSVSTPDEISLLAPGNMVEGLAQLPQFYQSNTTENTSLNPGGFFQSAGAGNMNLRGLDSKRTLQLLDGRRVVSSSLYGGPDANLFPEHLVSSIETVTGGASAAYGTSAVAGVVNYILDEDFEGYKAGYQAGENENGDGQQNEWYFSAGWNLGERAHVLVNIEKAEQDGIYNRNDYDWYAQQALLPNPAPGAGSSRDNPFFINVNNVVSAQASLYGIVDVGTGATATKYILDANGNPSPFEYGDISEGTAWTNGGNGMDNGFRNQIRGESDRQNAFVYADFDITDNFKVFGQYINGESSWDAVDNSGIFSSAVARNFTIFDGNPYLPASIQAEMTDRGLSSVNLNRLISPADGVYNKVLQESEMEDISVGFEWNLEGGFFDGWIVEGWYAQGTTDVEASQPGGARVDHLYIATDAVVDSNTGEIVCNIMRTDGPNYAATTPAEFQDCVPINLFGLNASPEAIAWGFDFPVGQQVSVDGYLPDGTTLPYSYTSDGVKKRVLAYEMDSYEIAASGELFEGWAGPISMALGYAWREESYKQYVESPEGNVAADPGFFPIPRNFPDNDPNVGPTSFPGVRGVQNGDANNTVEIQFSKVPFGKGSFEVDEIFTEFDVPLVSGLQGMDSLVLNAAARLADYTGSGDFWSWKGGLDWRINDEWRLRATKSQDVRAATMAERFDFTGGLGNVIDYLADPGGLVEYQTTTITGGNPEVTPEKGKTWTAGVIYQPSWAEGLGISVDYFDVTIIDNINPTTVSSVSQGCYQDGDQDLCALITRAGPPINDTDNEIPGLAQISLIKSTYINVNETQARGVDYEVRYGTDLNLLGDETGFLNLRLVGTQLLERSNTNSTGLTVDLDGGFGLPEWSGLASASYSVNNWRTAMSVRYTGSTAVSLNWNHMGASNRWDVSDNKVEAQTLVDMNVNYSLETNAGTFDLYLNVNNLFDADPETFPGRPRSFTDDVGNGVVGDLQGRRYTVGVNYQF